MHRAYIVVALVLVPVPSLHTAGAAIIGESIGASCLLEQVTACCSPSHPPHTNSKVATRRAGHLAGQVVQLPGCLLRLAGR